MRFSSRLFSVLLVFMLVGVVFVPAVAAESTKQMLENVPIEKTFTSDTKNEYIVYTDDTKTVPKYIIKQEKVIVDQKTVWKSYVYDASSDTKSEASILFGSDSYFWLDTGGVNIHFGQSDAKFLVAGGSIAISTLAGWIMSINGIGVVVAGLLAGVIGQFISDVAPLRPDGTIDVYISYITISTLGYYMTNPIPLPLVIRINDVDRVFVF